MYVCINLYHCPQLAAVTKLMFLCRAWSSNWVRKLHNASPCRLASPLVVHDHLFLLLASHGLFFFGRLCLNSWFNCASVCRQFSCEMLFRQFLISSSTGTWFAPPLGLSTILPSRKYLATILLAVDQFTPTVAATVK